ncbi:zf-HC2 domain-containing protein [bacterium]|nr:zf-HC2 domain-containing protein [bacterium]
MRKKINEVSCEEVLKKILEFIDGELEEASQDQIEQHLQDCRHCFDRLEFERLLKSRISRLKNDQMSERLRRRIENLIDNF